MTQNEIDKIESKKRYLKRYKKNLACVKRLQNKIDILDDRINGLKSPIITDMPKGGKPMDIVDLIADKTDLEKRLENVKQKSHKLKEETYNEIDRLNDVRYIEVLECMFIDCYDLDDIADELGYNRRHVQRLYSEALKELAL